MNVYQILDLLIVVLAAVWFALGMYHKVKGNVFEVVSKLIAVAEGTGLSGVEKMTAVVDSLYDMVPVVFRKVLTKTRLEAIAQYIFDWMRIYADEYRAKLEKVPQEGGTAPVQGESVSKEFTIDVITDLMSMTLESLKTRAKEYEIPLEGLTTKKELIRAIVAYLLS